MTRRTGVPARTVRHRLGRRGGFLLTGGIVWLLEAAHTVRHHPPVPGVWLLSHGWQAQAAAWFITGLVAVWAAFRRPGRDAPGWTALAVMGIFVVLLIADETGETITRGDWAALPDVLLSGGINFGVLTWLIIASGWREPVEMPDFEKGSDR